MSSSESLPQNLQQYYQQRNIHLFEGNSSQVPQQQKMLQDFAAQPHVLSIVEIGFNAGHSAELFLQTNPHAQVLSFDLGDHSYTPLGAAYLQQKFPNRHKIIYGDSKTVVPNFQQTYSVQADIIFIDGGHDYETAKRDLLNCKRFAHSNSIVIFDDTVQNPEKAEFWNIGPNKAWAGAQEWGLIRETGSIDFETGRGMSWGRYIM